MSIMIDIPLSWSRRHRAMCRLRERALKRCSWIFFHQNSNAEDRQMPSSSIKREITSIRDNGFIALRHIYKSSTDKGCTIM